MSDRPLSSDPLLAELSRKIARLEAEDARRYEDEIMRLAGLARDLQRARFAVAEALR